MRRARSTSNMSIIQSRKFIPHQGGLIQIDDESHSFVIDIFIRLHNNAGDDDDDAANMGGVSFRHGLLYTRRDFGFAQRLFHILDTESRGLIDRETVKEFVVLRCPVFWRRDDDLKRLGDCHAASSSPTFDEIWQSVTVCCNQNNMHREISSVDELGVEGWMVFCRFIALAQYLEAKRRFSARHLQQAMRQRNAPRGSEVILVDVPPLEPPMQLSPMQLASYERKLKAPLPLPELDLDHSLVAAHDNISSSRLGSRQGSVRVSLFGSNTAFSSGLLQPSSVSSVSSNHLEFAVTYTRRYQTTMASSSHQEEVVVRRSMHDMKWLNATFDSHKVLGGTLCGRILPPFHPEGLSSTSRVLSQFQQDMEDTRFSVKSTSGAISAAATAGVVKLRDAAKSFRSYLGSSSTTASEDCSAASRSVPTKKQPSKHSSMNRNLPESFYNPHSPSTRARHMERFLNYLLEHPALSTSFPLNTILKASQSGLEAAKEMLELCDRARHEMDNQTPHLDDSKAIISASLPNFTWVRTAAQAAMALHVHGILETTGMPSASARLQHASLPSLASVRSWDDDEGHICTTTAERVIDGEASNFEDGVVSVQSELQSDPTDIFQSTADDDYDLLPLPVPAPERRILSEGSGLGTASIPREARFHYGSSSPNASYFLDGDENGLRSGYLSDMAVDQNIDKLREVIGSVDNTLSRCLASSGAIGKAHKDRQLLHLEIVRGLDSFAGMRGKFVSQRSLMKGVAGIEQSSNLYEEGDVAMIDDLSWQALLAHSSVAAAEDVRSSVRASRVASNAKAAASSAAMAAETACESGNFATMDEARAAQTRASIAQSHAIHAAVVEHEAKTVKRRATLALANDVKVWNVHRKREMLQSCVAYARSQHEATRRAVDAWSSLRDGYVGSAMVPASHDRHRSVPSSRHNTVCDNPLDSSEVTTTIYEAEATIVASEHPLLTTSQVSEQQHSFDDDDDKEPGELCNRLTVNSDNLILPFATASPIFEEDENIQSITLNESSLHASLSHSKRRVEFEKKDSEDEVLSSSMESLVDGLMSWGGGIDAEEDHFALPHGVATSIVMEESLGWDHDT